MGVTAMIVTLDSRNAPLSMPKPSKIRLIRFSEPYKTMKIGFPFLLALLFAGIAFSQVVTEGGNVTNLKLSGNVSSTRWDGLYGDVVLGIGGNYHHKVTGNNVSITNMIAQNPPCTYSKLTMHVIAVNDSALTTPLSAGNLSKLDDFIGIIDENGTSTFTNTSTFELSYGTYTNVPTVYTYVDNATSTIFREGYFNDANGNLVFVTEVVDDQPDWNGTTSDYQIMLPMNGSAINYTLWVDTEYTCETPQPGGKKKHKLYIEPPGEYEVTAGRTFEAVFEIENIGDYVEKYIDVYLDCPSGFACGSGYIERLEKREIVGVPIDITVNGPGEYVLTVCAENGVTKTCQDFIIRVIPECNQDGDCGESEYCEGGSCEPKKEPKEECEEGRECISGLCDSGICVLCESNSECGEDEVCSGGACEPVPCPCGYVSNHQCIPHECCSDDDCSAMEFCIEHVCIDKELIILVIEGKLIEGEEVLVQIVNNLGDEVPFADIFTDDISESGDGNGYGKIILPYDGVILTSKDGYPQGGILLDVAKLTFIIVEGPIYVGQITTMQLVDSRGFPVPNAKITIEGNVVYTNENGFFDYVFETPGSKRLIAEKKGYVTTDLEVEAQGVAFCGFPIYLNWFLFDNTNIYVLWIVSIILAVFNFKSRKRRWNECKSLAYCAAPLVLATPNIGFFSICFMSNVVVLQTIIEVICLLRRKKRK